MASIVLIDVRKNTLPRRILVQLSSIVELYEPANSNQNAACSQNTFAKGTHTSEQFVYVKQYPRDHDSNVEMKIDIYLQILYKQITSYLRKQKTNRYQSMLYLDSNGSRVSSSERSDHAWVWV